jgi:hypothetical protein
MIWSIIYIILDVIWIGGLTAARRNYVWTSDGDTVLRVSAPVPTGWFVISGVAIAVRILTLVGAGLYNKWMVGIGAVWDIIAVILSFIIVPHAAVIVSALIFGGLIFYVSCALQFQLLHKNNNISLFFCSFALVN